MPFKNPFGGNKNKSEAAPPARISNAPGQSQDEQDHNREKMERELDAARTLRTSREADNQPKS